MKLFLFSDLHVAYKPLSQLRDFLVGNKDIDALVFAGDVLNMGEPVGFMNQFIEVIDRIDKPFFWVPGNNDFGRAYHKLNAKYPSLEGRVAELSPIIHNTDPIIRFSGVGGSPASWAGQYAGEKMIMKEKIAGTVFVSHVPPPGVHNYRYENPKSEILNPKQIQNQNQENSKQVSNFDIRASNLPRKRFSDAPIVHICGHIHTHEGIAYLGTTKIIKLAPMEQGRYAILETDDLSVEFGQFITNREFL